MLSSQAAPRSGAIQDGFADGPDDSNIAKLIGCKGVKEGIAVTVGKREGDGEGAGLAVGAMLVEGRKLLVGPGVMVGNREGEGDGAGDSVGPAEGERDGQNASSSMPITSSM